MQLKGWGNLRPDKRIVTRFPLTELWNDSGAIVSQRIRNIDENFIQDLMRNTAVQFIVADCGAKLKWIPIEDRYKFWKRVRPQIAKPSEPIHRDRFLNEIAYLASEWRGSADECLVLLEAHH